MDEEETFDFGEDELLEPIDGPDFRATIQRSGAFRLVHWGPWLNSTGPAYTLLALRDRAGIGLADLRVVRDGDGFASEVIVEFHSGGSEAHRAALIRWASAAGYRRVWFEHEVQELAPTERGLVKTKCTGCGQRFVDGRGGHFWQTVRSAGAFPTACALCGSDLPQWTPIQRKKAAGQARPKLRQLNAGEHARRR